MIAEQIGIDNEGTNAIHLAVWLSDGTMPEKGFIERVSDFRSQVPRGLAGRSWPAFSMVREAAASWHEYRRNALALVVHTFVGFMAVIAVVVAFVVAIYELV